MPCNSDHMEPNDLEREAQLAAELLLFIRRNTGKPSETWAVEQAKDVFAYDERTIPALCFALGELTEKEVDEIVYNARNAMSRKLADWWERHLYEDQKREDLEEAALEKKRLKSSAWDKLTKEEREALGLE